MCRAAIAEARVDALAEIRAKEEKMEELVASGATCRRPGALARLTGDGVRFVD